jgi:hypothetical protein
MAKIINFAEIIIEILFLICILTKVQNFILIVNSIISN